MTNSDYRPVPNGDRAVLRRVDDRDEAEIDAIADEFRRGFAAVREIGKAGVTVFGSARVEEGSEVYENARRCGALLAEAGFAVISGGGPGVMEAANRGAHEAGGTSVGFNILLPHEQGGNPYTDIEMTFAHFYSRKVMLVKAAEGFIIYPGGFGTNDELFEALTLIQTAKVEHFPVVLVGRDHWKPMMAWISSTLVGKYISTEDLDLLEMVDTAEEAVAQIEACFRRECAHELGATRAIG